MDPVLGLLGNIGGGLINNLFAGSRQQDAQNFAMAQMNQQYDYMRAGRQTAYQDTMSDMAKAGLNPILAYQKGATSGTMGGTPTPSAAPVHDVGVGAGINSALAMTRQTQELKNMEAQREKIIAETDTERKRPANVEADTARLAQDTKRLEAVTGVTLQEMEKKLPEVFQARDISAWVAANPEYARAIHYASFFGGKIGETFGPAAQIIKDVMGAVWSGVRGSSAGSVIRGAPGVPPTNSGRASKNMSDQDMIGFPSPNSYRRDQSGPAPSKPDRGWFTDRWRGMYE